jgi:hypothetical protein
MNKRYQVFISSTYADLVEERRYVMQALMKMNCIPAGMELFPAADEEQWEFIKKVINDCDYYLLIIGGRYGSTTADGISYTEKEFDYAIEKGIKVICLIHKNPGKIPSEKCENTLEMQKKLNDFCEKVKKGRLVEFWEKPEDLQGTVVLSLLNTINLYPAIGFVRANLVPDESAISEILKLRNRISELETRLDYVAKNAPIGSEELAQGEDTVQINYVYYISPHNEYGFIIEKQMANATLELSWNKIFSTISPIMVDEVSERRLKGQINILIHDIEFGKLSQKKQYSSKDISGFIINDNDFQMIKIQMKALGLITRSIKNRSVKDTETYWTLTSYGDTVMTKLIARKKPP